MKRVLPLILVAAAYAVATLVWIGNDRRIAKQTFDVFSAANTGNDGLSLAMKYLQRTGRRNVKMLTTPVDTAAPGSVIFRVLDSYFSRAPEEDDEDEQTDNLPKKKKKPEAKEKKKHAPVLPLLTPDEETFVRDGGRIVLAVSATYDLLSTREAAPGPAAKVFPIWSGLDTLTLSPPRTLQGADVLRRSHALYVIGDQPAIARIAIGRGDVILMATPEALDNEHIAAHLDLLTALAGDRHTIYFDETIHGLMSEGGTLDLLKSWRLGPMLILLLVVAAVTIWRGARSIGPREDDYRETRSEAVDLIASLGALYDSTTNNAQAIALYHHAFTQAVAAQTGLRGEALQKRIATLTGGLLPPGKGDTLDAESFYRQLSILNESFRRLEHAEHH